VQFLVCKKPDTTLDAAQEIFCCLIQATMRHFARVQVTSRG
jgi:hypothetical protein